MSTTDPTRYVLLPPRPTRDTRLATSAAFGTALRAMHDGIGRGTVAVDTLSASSAAPMRGPRKKAKLRVLDSIHEDGAKLVEASSEDLVALRATIPGIRVVPLVEYSPAVAPRARVEARPKVASAAASTSIVLEVVAKGTGVPIPGATVVAFLDFDERIGDQGTTNAKGQVKLRLGGSSRKVERLYVYPEVGYWGALRRNVTLTTGRKAELVPVDLAYTDALRARYGNAELAAGSGLCVGVIDTGVGPHPDLLVEGGENTVFGEQASDFGDNGAHHGTHVAGIIAARGTPPIGIRGLAPGVRLRAYRVFGKGAETASNFAIAKAVDRAVSDGCDLVNMSLGGGSADEATAEAIADARAHGALVLVATGNDDHSPVSFPASLAESLAVSAAGRKGTFPKGTVQTGAIAKPYGKDKRDFVAAFSNIGPEVDLTAPGVGILSTVLGGYAPMDGTSMACPAATGAAAQLLGSPAQQAILAMSRDAARSDAMAQAVLVAAAALGFGPTYEGNGVIP